MTHRLGIFHEHVPLYICN